MKNAVIITAKGGNTTVQNKNIIPICGTPIMLFPVRAARLAALAEGVFVSTEDPTIKSIAQKEGVEIIDRPQFLSEPTSQHKDVIKHAVEVLREKHPELKNVVVLLGNTVMVTSGLIDRSFRMLEADDCDSVVSVWKAQDDHPYRALTQSEGGYLENFHNKEVSSNRQSYPDVYFYDQGVWAFEADCALKQEGPSPWLWLGKQCRMIERPWVTGRDVHSWIDISASAWYLNSIQVHDYLDYQED
ncbi:NTP transferase domain-containing protein [bacterium]|nr:NTP transferase domain-containing protein [bacterium]